MPGPAVHNIVAERLADEFRSRPEIDGSESIADALEANENYLLFGSQGPDFLFFNMADWPVVSRSLVEGYLEVEEFFAELKADLKDMFPFVEEVGEWADQATASSHTLGTIRDIVEMISGMVSGIAVMVKTKLKVFLLDGTDVFSWFSHPIQNCESASDWWWFDALHYRKTGQFATNLLERGSASDGLRAYSVGYLSHVAADTVGHPYVNSLVRGPYRTHAQRHKVIENFQDVWAYEHYNEGELATSKLHERQKFERRYRVKLPDEVANAFSGATQEVFGDTYGQLSAAEVDNAYRRWYTWFEGATEGDGIPKKLPRYDPPDTPTKDAWENFLDQLEDIEVDFTGDWGLDGLGKFFEELAEAVLGAVVLALSVLDFLLSALGQLAAEVIYFLLSLVYKAIYQAYEHSRLLLALLGFTYPLTHHLGRSQIAHALDPTKPDARGRTVKPSWPYPIQAIADKGAAAMEFEGDLESLESTAHLLYPPAPPEEPRTVAGPNEYAAKPPSFYITDNDLLDAKAVLSLNTIEDLQNHQRQMARARLGNAVSLTVELFYNWQNGTSVPDLNLDGDRGMAYPPWEAVEDCVDGTLSSPVHADPYPGGE